MNAKVKKGLKITGIVLASLLAALVLLYIVLWIVRAVKYSEYLEKRRYVCDIPGLGDGFVPQGLGYSEEEQTYIMTGYHNDYTVLYLVKDNRAARIRIDGTDGKALKGHGGGVTCTGDYVYIAHEGRLAVYSLNQLIEAKTTKSSVRALSSVGVDNNASFCFSDQSRLFVGEFYRKSNFPTDESHHYTTPSGTRNRAIISCYPLDEHGAIAAEYPEYAISVTDLVQGFAVSGDTYMLSRSYGLTDSKLEYYSEPKREDGATVNVTLNGSDAPGKAVPLYYLDGTCKKRTITLPSFAEDLTITGGRVAVTTEAACNKYFIGKLFGATKVYSLPIY